MPCPYAIADINLNTRIVGSRHVVTGVRGRNDRIM